MKRYNIVNNTLGWLCFFISAATYLLTIEPTASFWDCPEFITQGAKLEVGHPPGNPIFMLTARFFVTIFGGDITKAAYAVNTMSALLSAATILLLFWTITHLVRRIIVRDDADHISWQKMLVIMGSGLCGALAYTWSDTFWYSAVEAEVYAYSSLCTALVFWLILKWENRADEPHSDRYLVLIAYVIGVSIAVHLLNLLCIPAIVLVFYFRKTKAANAKGSLIALGVSVVLVALVLYGLVPGFIKVAQGFELFFVNTCGMSYNMGVLIYAIVLVAVFVLTLRAIYRREDIKSKVGTLVVLMLSGLTFLTGSVVVWILLTVAVAVYLFGFCKKIPYRVLSVGILSILVIFIGYSSYALLLIRASSNPPMNQNAPDNVFTLSSYLNREQYGKTPLFYGPIFAESPIVKYQETDNGYISYVIVDEDGTIPTVPAEVTWRDKNGAAIDHGEYKYTKVVKHSPDESDKYVKMAYTPDYSESPDLNMLFPRMYSMQPEHINGYKMWSGYENDDLYSLPMQAPQKLGEWADRGYALSYELFPYFQHLRGVRTYEDEERPGNTHVWTPSMLDNIKYFLNYQLNHMYWRYFMWNFAGRQNDLQGNGEPHLGNWISGIPFIDNARLGDQSLLPDEFGAGNKGHNVFYMLPLLMGLFGLLWQSLAYHRANPQRGIEQFWVVFFLFFMTGIAIVLYLNQTPGQPRERDYAFAGSFYAFAIWVGMGVAAIYWALMEVMGKNVADDKIVTAKHEVPKTVSAVVATAIGILVPLQMVSQTWDDHDRSHRYTTRDFGANYLHSLDDNAVIFTNGDNDTFPLWYAQEVEGIRTDVRVVNLSYLATDWYANQLTHPYYDAAAVKMTAKPTDWAYDRLAYSLNSGGPQVDAMTMLEDFYDSAPVMYGKQPIMVKRSTRPYAIVDEEAAIKAFGLDPNSPDSIYTIPYISDVSMPGLEGSGFTLSKLLSFDIVANSINDNFERPVYFATTVPNDYYLGLQPNLSMTGVAYQVTPFANAPISPMVEKAYENIVSKFQWGGLDNPEYNDNLYLDETVRRMVSTMRNSMIETAHELVASGDVPASAFAKQWAKEHGGATMETRDDMARYLVNLMEEKLPAKTALYDASTELSAIEIYLALYINSGNPDDLARAEAIIDNGLGRYAQLAKYGISLSPYQLESMGYTSTLARYHLPLFIGLKNLALLLQEIKTNPEKYDESFTLTNLYNLDMRQFVYPYLYLTESPIDDKLLDSKYGSFYIGRYLDYLHGLTGISRSKVTDEVLTRYGIDKEDLVRLNPAFR